MINAILSTALPMFFRRRPIRRHSRRESSHPGQMILMPRGIELQGKVLDIGEGGCMFRPGLTYLVNRTGDSVSIEVAGHQIPGRVASTTPRGYGISFDEDCDIDALLN